MNNNNDNITPVSWPIGLVVECLPMAWGTGVQSQFETGVQSQVETGVQSPKTQKMLLDTSLLNTHHYKVRFQGKVEQSRERSSSY